MTRPAEIKGILAGALLGVGLAFVVFTLISLHATSTRLDATQHELLVSQKASTETRVTTVNQRCELTGLVLGVVERVDRPVADAFATSYRMCETQLATVKRINASTPSP